MLRHFVPHVTFTIIWSLRLRNRITAKVPEDIIITSDSNSDSLSLLHSLLQLNLTKSSLKKKEIKKNKKKSQIELNNFKIHSPVIY